MYKIAIDLMGSDEAPKTELAGVRQVLEKHPNIKIIGFGLKEAIDAVGFTHERLRYVYSEDVITGDDQAATAFRVKKGASMIMAIQAVKDGEADAIVSSGNTGALITSALFMLGRIKGIKRPALMSVFPTEIKGKKVVFGDLGAVADPDAETLMQNGLLASETSKILLGIKTPKVGLLNIGTEAKKGTDTYVQAHEMLETNEKINFTGNIESRYIMSGQVDAIVTGGFAGNIALKAYEGAISMITGQLKKGIMASLRTKIGGLLIKPALNGLKETLDFDSVGGAVVAGIKAPVIKTHGTTTEGQIASGILMATQLLERDLIGNIEQGLKAE